MTMYLSKKDAAKYTSLSVRSLEYRIAGGEIPCYRLGKRGALRVSDLEKFMARYRVDVTEGDQ